MLKTYYRLTKPGIVYGNAITAIAAFVFASHQHIQFPLFFAMLIGLSFSIAASCVVNNVIDRDIDTRMERTSKRALATGTVSVRNALIYAFVLGTIGLGTLYLYTNILALIVTLIGVAVYIALYTPAKRMTIHSTLIGAVAGAVPPVVGYVAVTNTFDTTAFLLFVILVCWQMTHFFAISIFRFGDYQKAGLPVMPVRTSIWRTKVLMLVYAFLFSYQLGFLFTLPMSLLTLVWIGLGIFGLQTHDDARWARRMFFYSLVILLAFSALLALS
jgi:protoheme IX farnesyltransferase